MAAALLPALLALPAAAAFAPRSLSAPAITAVESPSPRRGESSLRAARTPEAILFDCDGVLADTERDGHRLGFNVAFKENGIDEEWGEERYGKLLEVGGGKERMTAHWNEVGWPAEIPEEGRSDKILSLHLQKTDIFMRLIDEGRIPLRPGVLRVVDEAIAAGVRLAVCSTSNEKAVSNLVSTLMGEYRASKFRIFAGDMVKKKKPAPDVYLMAVEEMGLDKDRCVIVEDSHIGVGAAVAAGISCLVTKSSYTAGEDFTGAKMIVDELGDGPGTKVTLETLSSLLGDDESPPPAPSRGTGARMEGHIDKGGTSWTAARFGDDVTAAVRGPSGAYQSSGPRGIGVRMEGHIERGGSSWTGARFGDGNPNRAREYTPSETYQASGPRGIGVRMEGHVERGGSSWTGARFGDHANAAPKPSGASQSPGPRGIGVGMEGHVEKGGSSWTGARFGDHANAALKPSGASQSPGPRGIGVGMEDHVEKGGPSWTGARFGDDVTAPVNRPSVVYQSPGPRSTGVRMEGHVEAGGASWTGARLGDGNVNRAHEYTPSETYEFKSKGKGAGAGWDSAAHTDVPPEGGDRRAWSGARFGDEDARSGRPTPSQWHE